MLSRCAMGFGSVAFTSLLAEPAFGAALGSDDPDPLAPKAPHFPPRAKNVIYLYMDGGPSQIDTFDPKPALARVADKPFGMKIQPTQFNDIGTTFASPWKFSNYGQSGLPVSDLFPHVARHADDLCVVRSMVSEFSEHTNANYFLHTGLGLQGRPSMGAWITYGLGSENQDLPGFVVINGGLTPPGGLDCFASGFLPATFQGSVFRPTAPPVANINPNEKSGALQRRKLDLLGRLDRKVADRLGNPDAVESAIANHELAFRMQAAVPELTDLSREPEEIKELYGLNAEFKHTKTYAAQCLLARRMVERGVRFVELTCPRVTNSDRWDQHNRLQKNHAENARAVDQPIAALLTDLKRRGLLDETLVVWSGEFGRTPFAQGGGRNRGRDHNPFGFSLWMAGGGAKGGTTYGTTDEFGYHAVENKVEVFDLHATMLHLLGFDHTRLTFRTSGRDMRLTDVHGHVIEPLLA
ncbi:MAG: sulfatase [Planctomycetes bacterium]|nr:sulfatase [Planctomycetota bacterium]